MIVVACAAVVFGTGCATAEYVKRELGIRDEKIAQESATRQKEVEAVHARLGDMEGRFSQRFADRNRYSVKETHAVYFDFDMAELKDGAITTLVEVGRLLKEDQNTLVELHGHTDAVGPARYNLQLSRERAAAVVRHLVKNYGIGANRISLVGFGKETPSSDNGTTEGRAQNRRVDVTVLAPVVR
jgi:outer membrane protein OmpA-like peptidoglycan-associated protein